MKRLLSLFVLLSLNTQAAQFQIPVDTALLSNPGAKVVHYGFDPSDQHSDGNNFTAYDRVSVGGGNFLFDTVNYDNKPGYYRIVIANQNSLESLENDNDTPNDEQNPAPAPTHSAEDDGSDSVSSMGISEGGAEDLFVYHLFVDERLPGGGVFMNEIGLDPMCILGTGAHYETFAPTSDLSILNTSGGVYKFHGAKGFIFLTKGDTMKITSGDVTFYWTRDEGDAMHELSMIKNRRDNTEIVVPPVIISSDEIVLDAGNLGHEVAAPTA